MVGVEGFIDPLTGAANFLWSLLNQAVHFLAVTMWSWILANVVAFFTGLSIPITPMQVPNGEAVEQVNSMVSIIVIGTTFLGIGVLVVASMLKERLQNNKSSATIG